jgi:type IV pilus assembly protein PilE
MPITTRSNGFTVIELMIAVAIVAILAAIAIPAFNDQARKSRRSEAITELQTRQLRLEQWRANNPSFDGSGMAALTGTNYDFAAPTNATATTYTLTATAKGGQTQDRARGVSCSTLSIAVDGPNSTKAPSACW